MISLMRSSWFITLSCFERPSQQRPRALQLKTLPGLDFPSAIFFDKRKRAPVGCVVNFELDGCLVAVYLLFAQLRHVRRNALAAFRQIVVERFILGLGLCFHRG